MPGGRGRGRGGPKGKGHGGAFGKETGSEPTLGVPGGFSDAHLRQIGRLHGLGKVRIKLRRDGPNIAFDVLTELHSKKIKAIQQKVLEQVLDSIAEHGRQLDSQGIKNRGGTLPPEALMQYVEIRNIIEKELERRHPK